MAAKQMMMRQSSGRKMPMKGNPMDESRRHEMRKGDMAADRKEPARKTTRTKRAK